MTIISRRLKRYIIYIVMTSEEKVIVKFNEWLNQLYQSNQKTSVPEYALEIVRTQIHKRYGPNSMSDMNEAKIARVLRDIDFTDYYGKESEIMVSLDSKAIPEITPKCKEKIKQLLISMQPSYLKHCKKNNISFNYVMYKICQQFEQKALLTFLKLNLNHEKLYKYDRTWHLICDDMKWFFIKSDPTICSSSHSTPLLMGLGINVNVQLDRDLEEWQPSEIIKLQKGIERKLTLEQLAVGHNRSLKNIEAKLKSLVTEYHDSKEHDLESIKTLTGLPEDIIVDTISRHEFKKSRHIKNSIDKEQQDNPKRNDDMKELLYVMKDIQTMMRYLVTKYG